MDRDLIAEKIKDDYGSLREYADKIDSSILILRAILNYVPSVLN